MTLPRASVYPATRANKNTEDSWIRDRVSVKTKEKGNTYVRSSRASNFDSPLVMRRRSHAEALCVQIPGCFVMDSRFSRGAILLVLPVVRAVPRKNQGQRYYLIKFSRKVLAINHGTRLASLGHSAMRNASDRWYRPPVCSADLRTSISKINTAERWTWLPSSASHKLRPPRRRISLNTSSAPLPKFTWLIPCHPLYPFSMSQPSQAQPMYPPQYNINGADEAPRVPRRTPMACQFCRGTLVTSRSCPLMLSSPTLSVSFWSPGRKLKCDGSRPSCSNCNRRGYPCLYVPVYVTSFFLTLFRGKKIHLSPCSHCLFLPDLLNNINRNLFGFLSFSSLFSFSIAPRRRSCSVSSLFGCAHVNGSVGITRWNRAPFDFDFPRSRRCESGLGREGAGGYPRR
ncbi:hypothetical protein JVU11DRAFT_8834 [Chiua virens]|nr:hypothetical protein JVU11DRAFT_8834 [Chiua virens]